VDTVVDSDTAAMRVDAPRLVVLVKHVRETKTVVARTNVVEITYVLIAPTWDA
jgi:hypothetical protein